MKEVPEFEKYPVSKEEMGKRYKNWTEALANQMMVLYRVGKETGGENFVKRLKEEFFKLGENSALVFKSVTGAKNDEFQNCSEGLPKIFDRLDDAMANFWDGYIENKANVFEKEVTTCPAAKQWSQEPEFCDVFIGEFMKGMASALNPRFKTNGFSKLLVKGDKCCRYRIEMKD